MNKLTKIGVSALAGSLAAVSAANAGSMAVGGSAHATWTKLDYGDTGNPLGMATWLTFVGSGELDNGSTFSVTIAHDDKNAYSTSNIALTTPGLGTFRYDEGGGTGLDRLDDMLPTAWEEVDGSGVAMGLVTVTGAGGANDIEWELNKDMLPDGISAYLSYSPKPDGGNASDKVSTGATGAPVDGPGWDVVLMHDGLVDGLNVFAGYSSISQGTGDTTDGDRTAKAIGATYAVGDWTIGYQYSNDALNGNTGTSYYQNEGYGASFQVNDDLSLSYARHKSTRGFGNGSGTDADLDAQSIQAAYTVGGASIKVAETSVDSGDYVTSTAGDKDGTTISLSLAF